MGKGASASALGGENIINGVNVNEKEIIGKINEETMESYRGGGGRTLLYCPLVKCSVVSV